MYIHVFVMNVKCISRKLTNIIQYIYMNEWGKCRSMNFNKLQYSLYKNKELAICYCGYIYVFRKNKQLHII